MHFLNKQKDKLEEVGMEKRLKRKGEYNNDHGLFKLFSNLYFSQLYTLCVYTFQLLLLFYTLDNV